MTAARIVSQDALLKWDRHFGNLQAQVEQAKGTAARRRKERHAR
jgi:hypothetical protein